MEVIKELFVYVLALIIVGPVDVITYILLKLGVPPESIFTKEAAARMREQGEVTFGVIDFEFKL